MTSELTIRQATPEDADLILQFIQDLADFEKTLVELSAQTLADDLRRGVVYVKLAFSEKKAAGMTLYYYAYFSMQGQYLHMDSLNVRTEFRRRGVGRELVKSLAKEAVEKKIKRIMWYVFNWNTSALDFYKSLNAQDLGIEEKLLVYGVLNNGIRKLAET